MRLAVLANDLPYNRIVVIPAKGHRRAVDRNRAKRCGKELFRLTKNDIKSGSDLAIVLYPGDYSYSDRQAQLKSLLQRANLLIAGPAKES